MNSSDPKHPWSRLVVAARAAPDERDSRAPYGFSTRVAALAMAQERRAVSLVERFALRAVGIASVLALLSVAVNYSAIANRPAAPAPATATATGGGEDEMLADNAVALLIDA